MTRLKMLPIAMFGLMTLLSGPVSGAEDEQALIKSLGSAKVSLAQGLTSSQREGQPISAKFEMEDGKLQLSVYTMKGNQFSEVIVDHQTGRIAKTEAITGGEDLAAAKLVWQAVQDSSHVNCEP